MLHTVPPTRSVNSCEYIHTFFVFSSCAWICAASAFKLCARSRLSQVLSDLFISHAWTDVWAPSLCVHPSSLRAFTRHTLRAHTHRHTFRHSLNELCECCAGNNRMHTPKKTTHIHHTLHARKTSRVAEHLEHLRVVSSSSRRACHTRAPHASNRYCVTTAGGGRRARAQVEKWKCVCVCRCVYAPRKSFLALCVRRYDDGLWLFQKRMNISGVSLLHQILNLLRYIIFEA